MLDVIYEKYLLCIDVINILNNLSLNNINQMKSLIKRDIYYDEWYDEVHIGNKYCDIVGFNKNEIMAIELKSMNDDLRNVIAQLTYYKKWANKVLLVVDKKHEKKSKNIMNIYNWFGLYVVNNDKLEKVKYPPLLNINYNESYKMMTYEYLKKIAKKIGIRVKGKKNILIHDIINNMTNIEKFQYLIDYISYRKYYVNRGSQTVLLERPNLS